VCHLLRAAWQCARSRSTVSGDLHLSNRFRTRPARVMDGWAMAMKRPLQRRRRYDPDGTRQESVISLVRRTHEALIQTAASR